MFWLTNYLIVIVQVVYRGGFYVGNGINWKGQIFSKMHNHTVTNKMTVCLFLFHLLAITLEKWEGFKLSVFMLLYIFYNSDSNIYRFALLFVSNRKM